MAKIQRAVFKNSNQNCYCYNAQSGDMGVCHPVQAIISAWYEHMHSKGSLTVDELLVLCQNNGLNSVTPEEAAYYLKKHQWLERAKPATNRPSTLYSLQLEPQLIAHQLANLGQLTFEVTESCNLKCKYCGYGEFYNDFDERENRKLPVEKAKRLIDYLVAFWNSNENTSKNGKTYVSFYGGEPLMNMEFIKEIVGYVSSLSCNRSFIFSMTTNGMLLNRYMDFLHQHRFNLLISLDGNEQNNGYRLTQSGKESFDSVLQNVELLKATYPDYFENSVNFNSVLHNKNSVESIYHFFKQRYNKIPSIGELNNMGIRPDMQELFMQTYRNSVESLHQSENYTEIERDMFIKSPTYGSVSLFLHQYGGCTFENYNSLFPSKQPVVRLPTGTCTPFSKKMYVTVNGKLLACERIGHQFALGKITDTEVELNFEEIARRYNAWFAKLTKQCDACYNREACMQCIFNLQNLDGKPVCHGFMSRSDFTQYVASNVAFLEERPEEYHRIMEEVLFE